MTSELSGQTNLERGESIGIRVLVIAVVTSILLPAVRSLAEDPYLLFRNGIGEKMEMWLYVREPRGWSEPVMTLDIDETRNVKFPYATPYYVVLVDSEFRKDRLGWFSFHSFANQNQGATVALQSLYAPRKELRTVTKYRSETRSRSVTVQKVQKETRTRTIRVYNPSSGRYETVTQDYTVDVPVVEQVEQNYTVSVPYQEEMEIEINKALNLIDRLGNSTELPRLRLSEIPALPGENIPPLAIPSSRKKLGITFRMCPSGVHVVSVSPESPATRCRDLKSGEDLMLEVGDHIVEVNGQRPQSENEMITLISNSTDQLVLSVVDVRTGKLRQLTTVLD